MQRVPKLERELGKPPEQRLWRCDACGHMQVYPIPAPQQIASYYRPSMNAAVKDDRVDWAGGEFHAPPSYLRRLKQVSTGQPRLLLDVGFGSGSFLRAAYLMGYRVAGLDFDASKFQADFECELQEGLLRMGLFPDESFDVVAAHHVLEHVEDLIQALDVIHDLLRPGGHLLIELPHDMGSLVKYLKRAILRRGYTKYTRLQHLRFFTVRSLRAALERVGFQVELCRAIPSYELLRFPQAIFLTPLAPLEHWTGCGHNLEAIARRP